MSMMSSAPNLDFSERIKKITSLVNSHNTKLRDTKKSTSFQELGNGSAKTFPPQFFRPEVSTTLFCKTSTDGTETLMSR